MGENDDKNITIKFYMMMRLGALLQNFLYTKRYNDSGLRVMDWKSKKKPTTVAEAMAVRKVRCRGSGLNTG